MQHSLQIAVCLAGEIDIFGVQRRFDRYIDSWGVKMRFYFTNIKNIQLMNDSDKMNND